MCNSGEHVSKRRHVDPTFYRRLWAIGAIVPLIHIWMSALGKYDFAAFWIASRQAISGQSEAIYDASVAQRMADQLTYGIGSIFPYPPHALFFFIPFAPLPYLPSYLVWNVATATFFWWAARPYLPKGFPPILAVLTPAAIICMDFGQTGLLFGALWLLAFRSKWWAVALLTFKPHLGVLSALTLRKRVDWLRTIVLVLALIAVSAALFGPTVWTAFVEQAAHHAGRIAARGRWLHAGVSPAIGYGFWGWIPFAVGGGLLLARNINAFTAATAALLISPYALHYDMPVACLGFGLLIHSNWSIMPFHHRLGISLGFMAPVIAILGVWFVSPILLWALWVQVQYGTGSMAGGRLEGAAEQGKSIRNGTLEGARLLR